MSSKPNFDCKRLVIFGGSGLVGSGLVRYFQENQNIEVHLPTSSQVDLLNQDQIVNFLSQVKPDCIIDAAGQVGGINANNQHPISFISQNLRMQTNLFDAAVDKKVPRLVFLGSSCIYPKFSEQPIREEYLLSGFLEETNKAYAVAKIAGITQIQAIRKETGLPYVSVMPTNLYGPNDNFDLNSSHVIPALIGKFVRAVHNNEDRVVLWGDGSPLREFLHVDDLASALNRIAKNYDSDLPINVGSSIEITIQDLALMISRLSNFRGKIEWDLEMPNGTHRKLLDSSKMGSLGWKPEIDLESGLKSTIKWFENNILPREFLHK